MWSDQYYYLNIYSDENLSLEFNTKMLSEFLTSIPQIEKKTNYHFENQQNYHFIELSLLYTKSLNSWSSNDVNDEKTNLIAIVCEKKENSFEALKNMCIEIAKFVNWKLVDEQTDEGIENVIIWNP